MVIKNIILGVHGTRGVLFLPYFPLEKPGPDLLGDGALGNDPLS